MGAVLTALEESLKITKVPPESGATVALARKYARLLDQAAPNAKYRRALVLLHRVCEHYEQSVIMTPVDQRALEDMENTITVALGEHSVASDLGPKFLAALVTLGLAGAVAVPAAGGVTDDGGDPASDELERQREARRARERRA